MRRPASFFVALAISTAASGAAADCALDVSPARTLLLPYFEVDLTKLDKPKKAEVTTVTLTNHAEDEILVHVTFWTDLARPVMAYDISMPPFGSQHIRLHEVFDGSLDDLPGHDPGSGIAPPGLTFDDFIARQTGEPINGACLTFPRGDGFARGYITFDVVSNDTVFAAGSGQSEHPNVLTGVVTYNNRRRKNGSLEHLVHLQEGEGLGSLWAFNYETTSGSRTEVIVWRDPDEDDELDLAEVCDGPSDNGWYPLDQVGATVADDDGNMQEILVDGAGGSTPGFPLATGIYEIGRGGISVPYRSGTMYLDLSDSRQSWVGVRRSFGSSKRQGRGQAVPIVPIECQN